ncbi:MAG: hypothetical protein HY865_22350 [Chloroflexi bacterium]|nr:hypothetical protein [Chloroflexota bacterium]
MSLKNFNVFGMLVFVGEELVITATAFADKKTIERTFKFPSKQREHKEEAAMPFAAFIEDGKQPVVLLRRRAINAVGDDMPNEFVKTADIEESLEKVLDLMLKAA